MNAAISQKQLDNLLRPFACLFAKVVGNNDSLVIWE